MKKFLVVLFMTIFLTNSTPAKADFWGADLPLLAQILSNSIQQLTQLRAILGSGQDSLDLLRNINRGINDSLSLLQTVAPYTDPGLYKDWDKIQTALGKLSSIYGSAVPSTEFPIQTDTDQDVAEAITLNNSIYKYSNDIDVIGEQIKTYSHQVSPGGAQKLTAQTLGVMLNVMNSSLRAQATGLKLSAQALAVQNHKEKESTKAIIDHSQNLQALMEGETTDYATPRF